MHVNRYLLCNYGLQFQDIYLNTLTSQGSFFKQNFTNIIFMINFSNILFNF